MFASNMKCKVVSARLCDSCWWPLWASFTQPRNDKHALQSVHYVIFVPLFSQEFFLGCEAGFDGGHTPRYHVEVYEAGNGGIRRSFHLAHNITRSVPSFHVHQLKPLTAYAVVAYASNSLGREEEEEGDGLICCPHTFLCHANYMHIRSLYSE